MPTGTYLHLDPLDGSVRGVERFSCAPGPAGWRYVADVATPDGEPLSHVDLAVDARWRPARLELRSGGWLVRGGAAGSSVLWVRAGGPEATEHSASTPAFSGESPAFLIATVHMLRFAKPGDSRSVELTRFSGAALAAASIRQTWSFTDVTDHRTDSGVLSVAQFRIIDLHTGEGMDLHLAGDVVVAADGIELGELGGPPNPIPAIAPPE